MAVVPMIGADGDDSGPAQDEQLAATLLLLSEEPLNSYELITVFAERTDNQWRPDAATVQRLLDQLAEDGLVQLSEAAGWSRQRPYEITGAGRERISSLGGPPALLQAGAAYEGGGSAAAAPAVPPATGAAAPAPSSAAAAAAQPQEAAVAQQVPVVSAPAQEEPGEAAPTAADLFSSAMAEFSAAANQMSSVGTEAQLERAARLLGETKRGLYRVLADDDTEPDANAGTTGTA
ncbi:PadR family transcriptional regulator [Streptomonospora sediminis]